MKAKLAVAWLVCAGVLGGVVLPAHAAEQGAAETDDRAEAFRAVEHGETEDVPGGPLLLGAYALVWLFLLAYVFRLARLQRRTESELVRLQQSVEQASVGPADGPSAGRARPADHVPSSQEAVGRE